mmetsp:Transcript_56186/g.105393  ORF Transcript_56186/g.105393 Transcript_56186/m.105393 type:complete len:416 (-) Transcript_56186:235-1482(-)
MSTPRGRLEGITGGRARSYGRLTVRKSMCNRKDPTVSVIESRSALDVPSGRDFGKIICRDLPVMRSSAGCWPSILPQSTEAKITEREWEEVRVEHVRKFGFPNSSNDSGSMGDANASTGSPSVNSEAQDEYASEKLKQLQLQRDILQLQNAEARLSNLQAAAEVLFVGRYVRYLCISIYNYLVCVCVQEANGFRSGDVARNERVRSKRTSYLSCLTGEDASVASTLGEGDESQQSSSSRGRGGEELEEQMNIAQLQQMMTSMDQQQRKQLTYSLRPRVGPKFDPSAVRWEGRHQVSTHNATLHATHKDFFDSPQAFDMLTKPRQPLSNDPIAARLTPKPYDDGMGTLIFKKEPATIGRNGLRKARGSARRGADKKQAPNSVGERDSAHSESYLQPYALAKRTTGNALYVPGSFAL